jgi:thiol-disulfide isomerase/thioredoxin
MFLDQIMRATRRRTVKLTLACLVGIGIGHWGLAQQPQPRIPAPPPNDPGARKLLEEVSRAYRGLSSYSDQGEFVVALTLGGKSQKQVQPLKLTFVRPNKLDLDAGAVRLTSDGKTLTTAVAPLKKYTRTPAPEAIGLDTFRDGPTGSMLFGGPTGPPLFILFNLLVGTNPDVLVGQMGGSLRAAPPAAVANNAEGPALLIDMMQGPDLLLRVDPATKLLSSIDMKIDPEQLAKSAPPGQSLSIQRFGWASGKLSTQAPKDQAFAFEAPKGFELVDSFKAKAQGGGGQEQQFQIHKWIGKPAPDFSLTLLDGPGKTKTVTKAELAGKVVLIDFWATWCGPCLMELPEIQKLIESCGKTKKDVVIVALSQDSNPTEISEVRKLVEKTLDTKKITLTSSPVGRIGLDPSNSLSKAFDVEGFPTLVILDAKGVVQSAHVGYDPDTAEPLHKSLAKEIDALLEGKSLAPPGGGAQKKAG